MKLRHVIVAMTPLLFALPAQATVFQTTLSGANENPPNASSGSGSATVIIDGTMLSVDLNFAGLSAPASAGHIHCCAGTDGNAGVAVDFADIPESVGTTYSQTFDLLDAGVYGSAFLTSHGGSAAAAMTAFLDGLFAGLAYVNVHNEIFPAGEIRGQLAQVPEPAAALLLTLGMLALLMHNKKRGT